MRLYEIVITQSNGKEIVLLGSHPEVVILPDDGNGKETVLLGDPKETQLNPVVLTDVIITRDDTEVIIEPARGPQGPPGSSGKVNVVTWTLPCDPPEQDILEAINTAVPSLYIGESDFLIIKHCGIDYLYSGPLDVTIGLDGDYTVLQADITSITAGINNHPELAGLTDPDQHPQSAIIDLLPDQALQDQNLIAHTSRTDNPHQTTYENIGGTQPQPQPHLHTESEITDLDKYSKAEIDAQQGIQDQNLTNHENDTNNPHSVTYEQLGGTQPPPQPHTHPQTDIIDLLADQATQDQNLIDHENDTNNPHSVTYDQVGGAPLVHTHVEADITDLDKYSKSEIDVQQAAQDQNLVDHETAYNPHGKMNWKNVWTSIQYYTHDVVYDDGYAMVANKDTTDRAAPQAIGDPIAAYTGAAPTTQTIAKQVISGIRTTATIDAYINAYDVYVIAGNQYDVFSIIDPLGLGEVNPRGSFTAATTGWLQFSISPLLILAGTVFDLVALVKEPAPSPTTWTGNWNYLTPNNASIPLSGQISHADKATDELRINIVDNDGGNRSAELLALTVGDTVSRGGTTWAIQAIINNTSYITFSIAPQVQDAPDGVEEITFETVTATPITYMKDVDYWLTASAVSFQGLEGVDVAYPNIAPDNNAYGINFELQEASISDDWDLLSAPGGGGGDSGGGISDAPEDGTFYGRKDALWVNPALADITDNGSMAYEDDAPSDGKTYGRVDGAWVEITATGGGSNVTIGPDAPTNPAPVHGDQWWDNSSGVGQMRIYYTDVDTSQWVASNSGLKGDQGEAGPQGIQGPIGPQGDKGDTGDQGIQGIQGDKGDQGIQGEKGDQGDPGLDGDTPDVTTQDDLVYGRSWHTGEINPEWDLVPEEAPQDGGQYVRQDGAWVPVDIASLGASSSQQGFDFAPSMSYGFDHWFSIVGADVTVTISDQFDLHWRFNLKCLATTDIASLGVVFNLPEGKILAPDGDGAIIGFVSTVTAEFDVFGDLADE